MKDQEIADRYGLNIEALKKDQIKLAKTLIIKDSENLASFNKIGAIESILIKNKIISVV